MLRKRVAVRTEFESYMEISIHVVEAFGKMLCDFAEQKIMLRELQCGAVAMLANSAAIKNSRRHRSHYGMPGR